MLIPVRFLHGEPHLVFTRRSDHLESHPGEVSFPGGRVEAQDATPCQAALRETQEEIGLPPESIHVVGHLTDYQPHFGPLICTYVGVLEEDAPAPYCASPEEVAEVLHVPLASVVDPEAYPGDHGGEEQVAALGYEGRVWKDEEEDDRVVHYWPLGPETRVWGITGEILARFLAATFAWEPPFDPQRVSSWQEFRS